MFFLGGGDSGPSESESSTVLDYITKYTSASKVYIMVCIPGRLAQHLFETRVFEPNRIRGLILDEGGKLLKQSY
jgi:superfamily II DNA/RNA helicase